MYGSQYNPIRGVFPHLMGSPNFPHDTRFKVTLVARLLLWPAAQKLCRCERGVFMRRTCAHYRALLRTEIVCSYS